MIDINELRDRAATFGSDYLTDEEWVEVIYRLDAAEKDLITKEGVINSLAAVVKRLEAQCDAAEAEAFEQARLNGIGAERELALMAKLEAAEQANNKLRAEVIYWMEQKEPGAAGWRAIAHKLRAEIAEMKQQEPVAWMCLHDPERETAFSWRPGMCESSGCGHQRIPLYTLPAAVTELLDRLEAAESECFAQALLNGIGSEREARLMAKVRELEVVAKKMALDLECMILNPNSWKDSAHKSLQAYQDLMDRWYPQEHVSPLGAD